MLHPGVDPGFARNGGQPWQAQQKAITGVWGSTGSGMKKSSITADFVVRAGRVF